MKKIVSLAAAILLLSALCLSAAAVPIGTVVNHTLYTDIVAEIDGHPLRSYNVDNRTVVVAEDLRAYGFHAIWHAEERWLEVVRPVENGEPLTPSSYPDYKPNVPAGKIGTPAKNILATDIVTTVAGDKVDSWNIDGETVIVFRELERYGQVLYDNETRRSMYVTEPYKVFAGGHAEDTPAGGDWSVSNHETADAMTTTVRVGEDGDSWSGFVSRDKTDMRLDLELRVKTGNVTTVTLAFPPTPYSDRPLHRIILETLLALPVPTTAETVDYTNSPEVRETVAAVLRVTLDGIPVTGDLWRAERNGLTEFTFLFDKVFDVKPGNEITVSISTTEEVGGIILAHDASPLEVFQSVKNSILFYHETLSAENSLCYITCGYQSGTPQGNKNLLMAVYKDGGKKDLTSSVFTVLQTADSLSFGEDPAVLVVKGRVLSADKQTLTDATIKVDIQSGNRIP